jgi:hypothetical protein
VGTILLTPILLWATYGEIQPDGDSIVGLWHLNGNMLDATANGNNGSAVGDATSTNAGVLGQAYIFDGSGDFISIADSADFDIDYITVTFWGYLDSTRSGWDGFLGREDNYAVYVNSADPPKVYAYIENTLAEFKIISSLRTIAYDTWYFFALTYDGTTLILYINAEEEASDTLSGTLQFVDEPFRIGENPTGTDLDGKIDEVVLYDVPLTVDEIRQIYAMQKGNYGVIN